MRIKGRKQRKEVAAAIDRGLRLLGEKRRQEAHHFLEQAVQQFPADPELRMHYATSLLPINPEAAVAEAVKAIELDPDEPLRLTRAANMLFHMGRTDRARSYAARAKELAKPGFLFYPALLNLEGHFAAIDGNDELAEERLRLALEQEPDGGAFAVDLARFLAERDRKEEALGIIDDVLTLTEHKESLQRLRGELAKAGT